MQDQLNIIKYSTYAAIGVVHNQSYSSFVRDFVRNKLTDYEYDPRFKRFKASKQYFYYDNTTKQLCIPIEFTDSLIGVLHSRGVKVKVTYAKPFISKPINVKINPQWVARPIQIPAIDFLINHKKSMRGLALQTGIGKSHCAIRAFCTLNKVTLILTAGLIEQWYLALLEQTDLQPEDIYILKGYNSILDIMESNEFPKVFIGSIATMRGFVKGGDNYEEATMDYNKFVEHFGIGVKIVDECHENFHAIVHLDIRSNIEHNLYLSATYTRSNRTTLAIFERIFPAKLRYGEGTYVKYVNITFYKYNLNINERKVNGVHGYSHPKYEQLLQTNKYALRTFIDTVILPLINAHYINIKSPGQKLLLLVSKVDMVTLLVDELKKQFKDLTILPYTSIDPDDNYKEGVDIIVSTPRSSGTGVDILNLRTVINTVSTQAQTQIKQVLGRLRPLKNGDVPEMIDVFNGNIGAHVRHYKIREAVYKQLGKKYAIYRLH